MRHGSWRSGRGGYSGTGLALFLTRIERSSHCHPCQPSLPEQSSIIYYRSMLSVDALVVRVIKHTSDFRGASASHSRKTSVYHFSKI
jgi:hypothetical protein